MTDALEAQKVQVMRCMDKADKIGVDAMIDLLQKPVAEFGGGLSSGQSAIIGLAVLAGKDPQRARRVSDRFALIEILESKPAKDGRTLWDELIDMPTNKDETWSGGARPHNIGWALDDINQVLIRLSTEGNE